MKKKLEADLISIAHRILKLKNKSDINQLYLETQKLYEKLAVLKFIDENFDGAKPTIGRSEIISTIEDAFENETLQLTATETIEIETPKAAIEEVVNSIEASETVVETTETIELPNAFIEEEIEIEEAPVLELIEEVEEEKTILASSEIITEVETELMEEEAAVSDFRPSFEFTPEEEKEVFQEVVVTPKKPEAVQISFEDLMGLNYAEAHFVKVDEVQVVPTPKIAEFKETKVETTTIPEISVLEPIEPKKVSLNDKLSRSITIDLNDRLAFIKHLFGNNPEDYNRVYNQLITFDTFNETKEFIDQMVKPDYNDWKGKEDYEHRFIEIIEKKFL